MSPWVGPETTITPQTELFLIELLWGLDMLTSSPLRIWNQSFESWARRSGLAARIARLEAEGYVVTASDPQLGRLIRLTEKGRLAALAGRDPIALWNRVWDGHWIILTYDVPVRERALRLRLQRRFKRLHFGHIQGSVFISPDSLGPVEELLRGIDADPRSLFTLNGRPATGETDAQIVARAWNFDLINSRYSRYLDHIQVANRPADIRRDRAWWAEEHRLWRRAILGDPLLPRCLWPKMYRGEEAFRARAALFAAI